MELRKFIATTIREYLNENYHFKNLKAPGGIGKNINKTYGGNDDGIGVFWTDNLTMAKWFAIPAVVVELPQSNMFECDTCHEDYEPDESGICPHCGSLTTTAAAKLRCRLKRRNL